MYSTIKGITAIILAALVIGFWIAYYAVATKIKNILGEERPNENNITNLRDNVIAGLDKQISCLEKLIDEETQKQKKSREEIRTFTLTKIKGHKRDAVYNADKNEAICTPDLVINELLSLLKKDLANAEQGQKTNSDKDPKPGQNDDKENKTPVPAGSKEDKPSSTSQSSQSYFQVWIQLLMCWMILG